MKLQKFKSKNEVKIIKLAVKKLKAKEYRKGCKNRTYQGKKVKIESKARKRKSNKL